MVCEMAPPIVLGCGGCWCFGGYDFTWLRKCGLRGVFRPRMEMHCLVTLPLQVVMELSKKDALMCVCIRVSVPVRYLDLKTRRDAILIQY